MKRWLAGLFAWVVDRDGMVIDAAEIMTVIRGMPLGEVIGCCVADLKLPLIGESLAHIEPLARSARSSRSG